MDYLKIAALVFAVPLVVVLFVLLKRRPSQRRLAYRALRCSLARWEKLKPIEKKRLEASLVIFSAWTQAEIERLALQETPHCYWVGIAGDSQGRPEVVISGERGAGPTPQELGELEKRLAKPVFLTNKDQL